jgi:hypothetical protein
MNEPLVAAMRIVFAVSTRNARMASRPASRRPSGISSTPSAAKSDAMSSKRPRSAACA